MSEGPQVRRRAEWLDRHLAGRTIHRASTARAQYEPIAAALTDRRVEQATWHGKHLFIGLDDGMVLHNHMLMQGTWRRYTDQLLFPPPDAWIALYTGPATICNLGGQLLRLIDHEERAVAMQRLGPDIFADPFPMESLIAAFRQSDAPIGAALLEQSLLAGVGNIAKSESLHRAGIDPRRPACSLADDELVRVLEAARAVCIESYDEGGRWRKTIYRRAGDACPRCAKPIGMIRQAPGRRTTYFCPACQR
jgi:endonuclease-8